MEYILILACLFLITLLLEIKFRVHLYKNRIERIFIPLFFFVFGTAWDSYAVFRGHWIFSGKGLIGINIGLLPLEEYLFFLIIPYFILTAYKVLDKIVRKK